MVQVPASRCLWSEWDVSLHHFRSYERASLAALFGEGWTVEHVAYVNVLAFPFVWLVRRLRGREPGVGPRAEDRLPPRWLNALLRFGFVAPAKRGWCPAPFGVGLLLVARRNR